LETDEDEILCVTESKAFIDSVKPNAIRNYLLIVWSEKKKNRGGRSQTRLEDPPSNMNMRFGAYYAMSLFLNGHTKQRIPLPSCIMSKIREAYPDDNNQYVGFIRTSKTK
jgi:hypothetical protein